ERPNQRLMSLDDLLAKGLIVSPRQLRDQRLRVSTSQREIYHCALLIPGGYPPTFPLIPTGRDCQTSASARRVATRKAQGAGRRAQSAGRRAQSAIGLI